ncbi:MAG: hypothetical protein HWE07_12630 [Cytophagia bacterium]|nr:hypothetical protein [Cytophagia bacterium]
MKEVDQVLSKVFVKRFYSENAGFFLVLLGVCFGFLKAAQHFELNEALADKPVSYLIPIAFWLLYGIKVARFCSRVAREKESMMFGWIVLVGKSRIFSSALKVQFSLLLPILGYGSFMAYVALEQREPLSATIVLSSLLFLLLGLSFWYKKDLSNEKEYGLEASKIIAKWRPKYFFEFYIHYLLSFQGVRIVFVKSLSLLILYISIQVFMKEAIDLRYLTLGVLLSATANSFFSMNYAHFEREELQLFRNLPIGFRTKTLAFWLTFLCLSIPEFLVLAGQLSFEIPLFDLLSLMLIIPSLLMVFMALAYQPNFNQESFTKLVFFISATLFFVILGHVGALTLAILGLAVSALLLRIWLLKSEILI